MNVTQRDYEQRVAALVGEMITQVIYFTYDDGEGHPGYDFYDKPFHILDQGLLLRTKSDRVFSIVWGSEFTQYGLDFLPRSIVDLEELSQNDALWDVTAHHSWQDFVGIEVVSFEIYWASESREAEKVYYPQDIVLNHVNGKTLYLSASQYRQEEDRFWSQSDEVIVVFDDETAKTYLPMFTTTEDS